MGGSVTFFFHQDPWGQTPQLIVTCTKWHKRRGFGQGCAFSSKNLNFLYHLTPSPWKPPKFGQFLSGLKIFSLHFALALVVSPVNTRKPSSELPKSIMVNRQSCNVGAGNQNTGLDFAHRVPVTWYMTLKGQGRDPNIYKARYFGNVSR